MTDWLTFEGVVEPLDWGGTIYTILRLPPDIARTLDAAGARRVEGEIDDHPVNLALTRAPVVEGTFLWAGRSLLDQLDITPGQRLAVRLRKADPDAVETPDDVGRALRSAGRWEAWQGLSAGKRRALLYQIATTKRPETRAKRIAALVRSLEGAEP